AGAGARFRRTAAEAAPGRDVAAGGRGPVGGPAPARALLRRRPWPETAGADAGHARGRWSPRSGGLAEGLTDAGTWSSTLPTVASSSGTLLSQRHRGVVGRYCARAGRTG